MMTAAIEAQALFDAVLAQSWRTLAVDAVLIIGLCVVALGVVFMRNLFAIVMLTGVYSFLSATWFLVLDAADVAFTEAAVGAGVSTVLLLGAMLLTARRVRKREARQWFAAAFVTLAAGAALAYAVTDMPAFGDPASPVNQGVGNQYMALTAKEVGVPNVVTAVLASYRGYDTLGEVFVGFAAAIGVLALLGIRGPGQAPAGGGGSAGASGASGASRDPEGEP